MKVLSFAVLLIFVFVVSCSWRAEAQTKTILEIVQTNFTELFRHINNTALATLLNTTGSSFTLFAPTNLAFNNSPPVTANISVSVFDYHGVNGTVNASQLTNGLSVPTLLNQASLMGYQVVNIQKTMNWIQINNVANITVENINASNGLIHAISAVLFPPTPMDTSINVIIKNNNYATFTSLVQLSRYNLTGNGITTFAPVNSGFSSLPIGITNYLTMNTTMSNADLNLIFNYHVHNSPAYGSDLDNSSVSTRNGGNITVLKPSNWPINPIVLNGMSNVTAPNTLAYDGVVHGISNVLIPANFDYNLYKLLLGNNLTQFINFANKTGTFDILVNTSSPRTLFVPNNAAFTNVNVTNNQLLYHGVDIPILSKSIVNGLLVGSLLNLTSLAGHPQQLKFGYANGTYSVNNAHVVLADLVTSNGDVVHIINQVLTLPASIPTNVENLTQFSTFYAAVNHSGLLKTLSSTNNLTVFAPTNDAFAKLPNGTLGYLLLNNNDSIADLVQLLEYHVVQNSAIFYSALVPNGTSLLPALDKELLNVTRHINQITVNGAAVTNPDNLAANGVVHGINNVLKPKNVAFNLYKILEGLGFHSTLLYLQDTGVINNVTKHDNITFFAPTEQAWEDVANLADLTGDTFKLTEVLLQHIVYEPIPELYNSRYFTGVKNQTIVIANGTIQLVNDMTEAVEGHAVVTVYSMADNGYLYGISAVLGVPQESSSSGLQTWQIVLIVVGAVVVGLLLLGVVLAIVYFVFLRPRGGYSKIN